MWSRTWAWLAASLAGLLLAGCAANPPRGLESLPPGAPTVAEVRGEPARHLGRQVRWGGEILGVDNLAGVTEVEIFSRPLFDNAEPRPEGGDGVRFIARVPGFLDPAQYRVDKRMTVVGRVVEPVSRPVGEYPYRYPVVDVQAHHLWPVYQPPPEPAWLRDPYYDPWWPWGPWGPYRPWPYWY
jgi:outer membrane lipoprotein